MGILEKTIDAKGGYYGRDDWALYIFYKRYKAGIWEYINFL